MYFCFFKLIFLLEFGNNFIIVTKFVAFTFNFSKKGLYMQSMQNFSSKPIVPFSAVSDGDIPSTEECFRLWDEYEMMDHIKKHSELVARVAVKIASKILKKGINIDIDCVRASALLHDIAKTYTIKNGGYHTQLGAAWMLDRTKNHAIAQGILHHVFWPGPLDIEKYPLPLIIIYSDKRVKHDKVVSLEERMRYILNRYGKSYERMQQIIYSFNQAREIEKIFNKILEVNLRCASF